MLFIWHTFLTGKFSHQFENKDTPFWVEGIYDLAYELCYWVDVVVNQILTEPGLLVQWHCDFSPGCFKQLGVIVNSVIYI